MVKRRWRVRLSDAAERDFLAIIQWTAQNFGRRQAIVYRRTLLAAVVALYNGPNVPDSAPRDEIQNGMRSVHVARKGRRGRHFILYRSQEASTIEILRILHDSMDLGRLVPLQVPPPGS